VPSSSPASVFPNAPKSIQLTQSSGLTICKSLLTVPLTKPSLCLRKLHFQISTCINNPTHFSLAPEQRKATLVKLLWRYFMWFQTCTPSRISSRNQSTKITYLKEEHIKGIQIKFPLSLSLLEKLYCSQREISI
jgi:hypothetical protein